MLAGADPADAAFGGVGEMVAGEVANSRVWMAPLQTPHRPTGQQTPYRGPGQRHPGKPLNRHAHPFQGPQVRLETVRLGALLQRSAAWASSSLGG